ncbi:mitochondrial dicarboxylate carrier [Tanacetum coccineum]
MTRILAGHHELEFAAIAGAEMGRFGDEMGELGGSNGSGHPKGVIKDGFGTHVTASFATAFVAAVASNAVAVIKTRVMNVKVAEGVEPPYKGAVDCAVNTVKAEGHERDARMAVGPVSRVMWHRVWGASFIVRTTQDVSATAVTPPSP